MRLVLLIAFSALLVADWWTASAIVDAAFPGACEPGACSGAIYWSVVGIITALLAALCWATWRVWLRLRATFAN